jgi:hypothetical protein
MASSHAEDVADPPPTEAGEDLAQFLGIPSDRQPTASLIDESAHTNYAFLPTSEDPLALFQPIIVAVGVVGFDHVIGSVLEFLHPPLLSSSPGGEGSTELALPDEWRFLPSLALPDGCHHESEDFCYFSIPARGFGRHGGAATLYGTSMFRQVRALPTADPLTEDTNPLTRNRIQKAIFVLASAPMYGPIQARLWGISHAYFSQGLVEADGFHDYHVLADFYHSLTTTLSLSEIHEENLHLGFPLRRLLSGFGLQTLTLVKLLLLEKRVLFTGLPVSYLCSALLTVVSLVPGLLAWPFHIGPNRPADFSRQERLFASFALPLKCFAKQALFPYLCLQQMDDLCAFAAFFGASSNPLFQRALPGGVLQVLVDVEQHTIQVLDPLVSPLLTLSAADRTFMHAILTAISEYDTVQTGWKGSDDWIRSQFQQYVLASFSISFSYFFSI